MPDDFHSKLERYRARIMFFVFTALWVFPMLEWFDGKTKSAIWISLWVFVLNGLEILGLVVARKLKGTEPPVRAQATRRLRLMRVWELFAFILTGKAKR